MVLLTIILNSREDICHVITKINMVKFYVPFLRIYQILYTSHYKLYPRFTCSYTDTEGKFTCYARLLKKKGGGGGGGGGEAAKYWVTAFMR